MSAEKNWIAGVFCHSCGKLKERISTFNPTCRDCSPLEKSDDVDDYYLDCLKKYRGYTLEERRAVKPLWDDDNETIRLGFEWYKLERISTSRLVDALKADNLDVTHILNNAPRDNRRVMSIVRAWEQLTLMPPIRISMDNGIEFGDGRHRTLAALFVASSYVLAHVKKK